MDQRDNGKFIKGQTYSFKKVSFSKEKNPNWKGGKPKCLDCGERVGDYKNKRCRSCDKKGDRNPMKRPEVAKKISEFKKGKKRLDISGDKCHLWKGGITPINVKIRNSAEYKIWRRAVFERDNYTCVWCGRKEEVSGKLNADHIKPFAYFPELRLAIDNGRTLCIDCHKKTNNYLNRWIGLIK